MLGLIRFIRANKKHTVWLSQCCSLANANVFSVACTSDYTIFCGRLTLHESFVVLCWSDFRVQCDVSTILSWRRSRKTNDIHKSKPHNTGNDKRNFVGCVFLKFFHTSLHIRIGMSDPMELVTTLGYREVCIRSQNMRRHHRKSRQPPHLP